MNLRCIYILLLALPGFSGSTQEIDEKNFRHYTVQEGLSNNYITGIEQDAYGYVWIATYKGLNRYDGSRFQQFYSDSSKNSLPQDLILKLKWLDQERLAAMTFTGLHIINTRTLQSHNIIIPQPDSNHLKQLNKISDAVADKNGNLFISTLTGFYQFNNKEQLVFRYDHSLNKHRSKAIAFGWNIITANDSVLLLSTFDGPYIYYTDRRDLHPIGNADDIFYQQIANSNNLIVPIRKGNISSEAIIPGNHGFLLADMRQKIKYSITTPFKIPDQFDGGGGLTMLRQNDSTLVFNTKEFGFYLIHYNSQTKHYTIFPRINFPNYLCTALLIDKNNRLWIGTNDGLFHEKKPTGQIEQLTLEHSSLKNYFLSMAVSKDRIFLGTSRDGLLVFDRANMKQLKQIDFSGYNVNLSPNTVYPGILINPDTLYTGTVGTWIHTKNLSHGIIKIAHLDSAYDGIDLSFKDSKNNLYLKKGMNNLFFWRGDDGIFKKVDYRKELLQIGNTKSMTEDADRNIWFVGNGMKRFNHQLQKFDLMLDSFPVIKTRNNSVSSNLVFDKTGKMYFGVAGNGLIIYDPKQKTFSQLSRSNGLPDNTIHSLYINNNKLWMGTESGLANYDISTKNIFSFGAADGIPTNPFATYLLYYDTMHRHLYGAFRNTVFRFNPDSLSKSNSPPEFSIETLVISGKKNIYHPANEVELSYKDNNVVVNLASVNFEDAYNQQFAYRLIEDQNTPWQEIGSQRSLIFSNLSAGRHTLQFKVYTRDGSWMEQLKEITLIVKPPFWKTSWFYVLAISALTLLLFYLHRLRINSIKQKTNLDKLLAQTEMKALHAQMNPHFIFNCLNSIREMILNNENKQASHYLNKFAQLLRITLNQSSRPFVSLENTIDYLQRYLEMEKIRALNFTHTIEVEKDLAGNEIMLPPMLIQPFIENAIWHGAASPEQPMKIDIRFEKKQQQLLCIIDDNGIGIETSLKNKETQLGHNPVGIDNIKQRIKLLNEKYNMQSTITIEDKSSLLPKNGTGTIVKLRLPIKKIDV